MNKVASYLQGHISGEVIVGDRARDHFSTDASILTIKPSLIVYPRTTNDIRKVARFSWQLAERGHVLPITARGNGTDMNGAAIGKGVIISFPAHLNKILEIDTKQKLVRVEPGVNFKSLQETLQTHGLYLPPQPESYEYSTIGGAIANNARGSRSSKYGSMSEWVDRLEVVLANGEVIQTGPLSKKELSKKLGLPTLEGELYRAVDAALNDNQEQVNNYSKSIRAVVDHAGYQLDSLRTKKGTTDLTPLFVGSQGTLGIIAEAILRVTEFNHSTVLVVAGFASIDDALDASEKIATLRPSVLDVVDGATFEFAKKHHTIDIPQSLLISDQVPAAIMFAEMNLPAERARGKFVKQTMKVLNGLTESMIVSDDYDELEKLWTLRYTTALYISHDVGGKTAVSALSPVSVPDAALHQFLQDAKVLCKKHHADAAIWTHVMSGCVKVLPLFDLSKLGDRQHVFKLMDEYYRLVIKLGGSIVAEGGEGRLQGPFAELQLGDISPVYTSIKFAADPHQILNPGVKAPLEIRELVDMLRKDFSLDRFADYLPRM